MKKLAFIALIFLFSCNVKKIDIPQLTDKEVAEYTIQNDTIYLRNEKIAYLSLTEWEYYKGNLVQELSLVQYNMSEQNETLKLMAFVHKKHPKAKIEVKFKKEN